MKRPTRMAVILFLALMVTNLITDVGSAAEPPGAASHPDNPSGDYIIGSGDILEISVWKEPDLAKQVTVLPDGSISFPLIGQIHAEGLTLNQLKEQIEQKILRFVPHPNLTVAVFEVRSLYIYIVGKVYKSGRFEFNADIDVLQALAMAGGLNPYAKKSKIKIFRKHNGSRIIFDFDYDQVTEGKHLDQNLILKRGDVIVVP